MILNFLLALPRTLHRTNHCTLHARQVGILLRHCSPRRYPGDRESSTTKDSGLRDRRKITVVSDNGRVPWKELTAREKAARTTQQTFNVGLLLLGIGLTGTVATVLYLEVFSGDSKTAIFNRTADRVRTDAKCQELLVGAGIRNKREISAYGEPSWSRWARNRTINSHVEKDKAGTEHLHMRFFVEGGKAKGTITLHMCRSTYESEFRYHTLALDVPGQPRYYLENVEKNMLDKRNQGKMFGVRWN